MRRQEEEIPFTGEPVPDWTPPVLTSGKPLDGSYCRLRKLGVEHADALFAANAKDKEDRIWLYLPYGPFSTPEEYRSWIESDCSAPDPWFYAIIDPATDSPTGVASYLRINPQSGSIEVGHINYSPLLQNTIAATEAMYLMMRQAFDAGYRRYEWKCNALNQRSCNAAKRLGFTFEGIFRQATVVKNRNRDTAWFSIIDKEWPVLDEVFQTWLAEDNFDARGHQKTSLSALTRSALADFNKNR